MKNQRRGDKCKEEREERTSEGKRERERRVLGEGRRGRSIKKY